MTEVATLNTDAICVLRLALFSHNIATGRFICIINTEYISI